MRVTFITLMAISLIGCGHQSVEVNVTATTHLEKPSGLSSNPRIGFAGRGSTDKGVTVIQLAREAFQSNLSIGEHLVSRNRALRPTSLLKISEIRGMAAQVVILRGKPDSEDEIVLPSPKLKEEAESLPLVKTDT